MNKKKSPRILKTKARLQIKMSKNKKGHHVTANNMRTQTFCILRKVTVKY